ncbi:MAG TPA: type II CAAX endopeptidase family protein [Anaerolineales bacterium]|nr:type II CAAX endopeptidase family protein [Anaerolineales bacterium]
MPLRNLFFSPKDGRLRAGWRIAFFFVLYFSITFLLAIPAFALMGFNPDVTNPRDLLFASLIGGIASGLAVFMTRRSIDRKSVESLGLAPARMWRDLLAGVGIGTLMIALIYLFLLVPGWLVFEGFAWETDPFSVWALALLNLTLAFILVGISEEVMVRGYILQNIEDGLNLLWAIVISSSLFALLHLGNPGGAAFGPIFGIFLAGLFFAYAYLRTRSLWLAIGLHFGWNLAMNAVFGFAVSGADAPGLLHQAVTGPEIWTGGAFGPEAGLVLLPALAAGVALVAWYTRG